MARYANKAAILSKKESSYGVDPTPVAGTDAVLLRSIEVEPLVVEYAERKLIRPFFGNYEDLPAKSLVRLTLEQEIAGFGTAGPATPTPGYDSLQLACGQARTHSVGVSEIYKPITTLPDSATIYFYDDGLLHKGLGARGNLEMVFPLNDIPFYRYTMMALYGGITDVAVPSPTLTAYQRPLVVNQANTSGLNIHGLTTARMKQLSINYNNQVEHRNLVGGAEEILITGRAPDGQIEIEGTTVATKDWWTLVRNATLGVFSVLHGTAVGNRVQIDGANVQLTGPGRGEDQGIIHLPLGLKFMPSAAGNDEVSITIT